MKTILTKQVAGQAEKIHASYMEDFDTMKMQMVKYLAAESGNYRIEDDGSIQDVQNDYEILDAETAAKGIDRYSYDNLYYRIYTEEQAIAKFGQDRVETATTAFIDTY